MELVLALDKFWEMVHQVSIVDSRGLAVGHIPKKNLCSPNGLRIEICRLTYLIYTLMVTPVAFVEDSQVILRSAVMVQQFYHSDWALLHNTPQSQFRNWQPALGLCNLVDTKSACHSLLKRHGARTSMWPMHQTCAPVSYALSLFGPSLANPWVERVAFVKLVFLVSSHASVFRICLGAQNV